MDPSSIKGASSGANTEWSQNPSQVGIAKPKEGDDESFGAKLNRLSGIVDKGPHKYGAKDDTLNKEAFLKMTMEQIKYQDPLNPVKNEQFTQQMAMLSQLEQQVNMNTNLKTMIDNQSNMQIAALQLVGKEVKTDSSTLHHEQGKAAPISFDLPTGASKLSVDILKSSGEVVDTIQVDPQQAGKVSTKWDGLQSNDLPAQAGKYYFRVNAQDVGGKEMSINAESSGRVTGVTTSNGQTYLLLGEQKVALTDVRSIHEPKNEYLRAPEDKKPIGTESVTNIKEAKTVAKEPNVEQDTEKVRAQIAVSDDVRKSLLDEDGSEGGPELSSVFPLLYR